MSKINRKQIALIHVAKSKLNLGEEEYRDILEQFGVSSSKDLSRKQFKELLNIFTDMGFDAPANPAYIPKLRPSINRLQFAQEKLNGQKATGSPHTLITDKQKEKIWMIWNNISKAPEEGRENALNSLCKRVCKVDHWEWLTVKKAQQLIYVLEKMQNG